MRNHAELAEEALARYETAVINAEREAYFVRLLAEAQVHATLAIATELERQRMAGWGQPA